MQRGTSSPATIIAAMLSGFPSSQGTDVDMQIRAYLMAVEGIDIEAIAKAAKLYIAGQVKDQDLKFAPSCALFADTCRYQQAALRAALAPAQPKAELKPEYSEQHRVNMLGKMKILASATKGDPEAIKALEDMGYGQQTGE